jgi:hypothetical protein
VSGRSRDATLTESGRADLAWVERDLEKSKRLGIFLSWRMDGMEGVFEVSDLFTRQMPADHRESFAKLGGPPGAGLDYATGEDGCSPDGR